MYTTVHHVNCYILLFFISYVDINVLVSFKFILVAILAIKDGKRQPDPPLFSSIQRLSSRQSLPLK